MYAAEYDSESDLDHSTGSNDGDDGPAIAKRELLHCLDDVVAEGSFSAFHHAQAYPIQDCASLATERSVYH
jgi:hypothetical protein